MSDSWHTKCALLLKTFIIYAHLNDISVCSLQLYILDVSYIFVGLCQFSFTNVL